MIQLINDLPAFLLILTRISSFFATVPLFSYRNIPSTHKIGLSVFIAFLLFIATDQPSVSIDGFYFLLVIKEALVGLIIGLVAFIILAAIQIAGSFIDFQMGFAIANVMDPQTGLQSPITGQYLYTIAIMLLLAVNGHHLLLDGIFYSYQYIPLSDSFIPFGSSEIIYFVIDLFNAMFVIAFQMAIPVVGCLFLVDVALGIVARTVPQLNVFVVGLPLKILVGFIVLILVIPVFIMLFQQLFEQMLYGMRGLMELIGDGTR